MSGPSESSPEQKIHESDGVLQDPLSLNLAQQTLNQPDPLSNPDPDPTTHEPDSKEGQGREQGQESESEKEKGGGEEQHTPQNSLIRIGMNVEVVPPVVVPRVSVSRVTSASPSNYPNPRRGPYKRKKAKPNPRKEQSIQRKLESLKVNFNPIPFRPVKILDFSKHEKLLKKLGLWDFVHIDFDRNIRVDLLEQLVVTYDPKTTCAFVNSFRLVFSRSIFAHALCLPPKRRVNACGVEVVVLEPGDVSEDTIGFLLEFVSDWVLLHEDTWMTPHVVMDSLKLIKDGHPDKVDWAGLFRFMAENELRRGDQLKDCYYASHLQHVMKFQNKTLFTVEEDLVAGKVEVEAETKEEKEVNGEDVMAGNSMVDDQGEKSCVVEAPSIELTLGQDGEKEDNMQDVEMTVVEKCKEDGDGDGDGHGHDAVDKDDHGDVDADDDREEVGKEQTQWLLHAKNNLGEHFLQPCSAEDGQGFGNLEDGKEDEVEETEGDGGDQGFDIFPAGNHLDGEGLTGNFLQAMEANQVTFSSQERLHDPSSADTRDDMECMDPSPSFFNPSDKRVIEHDADIDHHSLNDRNKRLRIDDSWNLKPPDFNNYMVQVQQLMEKCRSLFEEKEQALEQANMNQQILLNELQKRDSLIEHLHKSKIEEAQKKDGMIYRLERELYLVESVMDGYRKTLKETQKAFAEYRQQALLTEEPTYKDAGPGGLMLSTTEIEKLRQKREEEYKMNCILVEQKWKEAVEHYMHEFDVYVHKINILDKKLTNVEANAKELIHSCGTRNVQPTEDKVDEASTTHPVE